MKKQSQNSTRTTQNTSGISLISLIITIIVIIILAAIVIFSGLGTPESAGFANFCQQVDNVYMAVMNKHADLKAKHSVAREYRTDEQIYIEIATATDHEQYSSMNTLSVIDSDSETGIQEGSGIQNIEVDAAKITLNMTLPKVRESNKGWYVTKEGRVFNANGYVYNEKTYFTSAIYQEGELPAVDSTNAVRAKKIYEGISDGKTSVTEVPETNTYTVTFNSNGGTDVASIEGIEEGAKISKPADPTKANKEFGGWYKNSGLTNAFDFTNDTINGDITLYAKWNTPIAPGTEFTINNEDFYYLWDDENDSSKAVLLAKYNLNTAGTAQAANAAYNTTACQFSQENYWPNTNKLDLNEYPVGANETTSNNAVLKAGNYATTKIGNGAEGRLLTWAEANYLKNGLSTWNDATKTKMQNILWGTDNQQSNGNYLYYWLGSAYTINSVSNVYGSDSYFNNWNYDISNCFGVRPVIVIPKSALPSE